METKADVKEETRPESKNSLKLVIEILPGQAKEGVINCFGEGTWEKKNLNSLVQETIKDADSKKVIDQQAVLTKVKEQMKGGKLLYNGQEIGSNPMDYVTKETSGTGAEYYYLPLRLVKPQEGGSY